MSAKHKCKHKCKVLRHSNLTNNTELITSFIKPLVNNTSCQNIRSKATCTYWKKYCKDYKFVQLNCGKTCGTCQGLLSYVLVYLLYTSQIIL